jgi:hypothetical protein
VTCTTASTCPQPPPASVGPNATCQRATCNAGVCGFENLNQGNRCAGGVGNPRRCCNGICCPNTGTCSATGTCPA